MPTTYCDQATDEDSEHLFNIARAVTDLMEYLECIVILICFSYIFCCCCKKGRRRLTRQFKCVWFFVLLTCFLVFVDTTCDVLNFHYDRELFWVIMDYLSALINFSTSIAHWVFAISYFETAMMLPVVFNVT